MQKWIASKSIGLVMALTLALSGQANADGSENLSLGVASLGWGSVLVVAGGSEVLVEVAEAASELTVASVEVAGEVVIVSLEAGVASVEQVVLHLSAASVVASSIAVGSVVVVTEVTSHLVGGASVLVGHLLVHAGEALLFIPHHALALGLHSHELAH